MKQVHGETLSGALDRPRAMVPPIVLEDEQEQPPGEFQKSVQVLADRAWQACGWPYAPPVP